METIATQRELIDLPVSAINTLKIKASLEGLSLKKFLEQLLLDKAREGMTEEELYQFLCNVNPKGSVVVSKEEAEEFEKMLNL